jgi:ligand-binding sensor protein
MTLWELKSKGQWQEILDSVSGEFGIHTMLADAEGKILLESGRYNSLCSKIRANPESLTFVCSQTNKRMFHLARESKEPCNDFCEAGMYKTVITIFSDELFLGGLSACGIAVPDEPLDEFLVAKALGIEEPEAGQLISEVPKLEEPEANRISDRLFQLLGNDSGSD